MKHITLLPKEEADPELREAWDAMRFDLAIFHVWAHAPKAFVNYVKFNHTVWLEEADDMPLLLKEMAVVHASVLANSSYEWGNHGASVLRRGGTQAQLEAIITGDLQSDAFDETQKLVLQFTNEVVLEGRPAEPTLTAMGEKFTSRQLTQLVFGICAYMTNSRLASLGGREIGDDDTFGMKIVRPNSRNACWRLLTEVSANRSADLRRFAAEVPGGRVAGPYSSSISRPPTNPATRL